MEINIDALTKLSAFALSETEKVQMKNDIENFLGHFEEIKSLPTLQNSSAILNPKVLDKTEHLLEGTKEHSEHSHEANPFDLADFIANNQFSHFNNEQGFLVPKVIKE